MPSGITDDKVTEARLSSLTATPSGDWADPMYISAVRLHTDDKVLTTNRLVWEHYTRTLPNAAASPIMEKDNGA